jgi:hypothetical protein
MKRYVARRRLQAQTAVRPRLMGELRRLLKMVKNNVALDLRSLDASVWFVSPKGLISEKNNLACAKVIVVQGFLHVAG